MSGTISTVGRTAPLSGITALVVEDDPDTRDVMVEYLAYCGADAIGAPSVAQAITVLSAVRVDIVITDVAMPGEDGYSLLAKMDRSPAWAAIPRIIVSGHASDTEAHQRASCEAFFAKPFRLDSLVLCVKELCPEEDPTASPNDPPMPR